MDIDDSNKIILEEARKSYDISIESIKSYDSKIQQIVVISTGILAFIFTIGGFFSIEFTLEDIQNRVKKFLDKVYKKHPKDTVIFVAHGGSNNGLITLMQNKPAADIITIGWQSNTSVCVCEIREDKKHKIHVNNCTRHLD